MIERQFSDTFFPLGEENFPAKILRKSQIKSIALNLLLNISNIMCFQEVQYICTSISSKQYMKMQQSITTDLTYYDCLRHLHLPFLNQNVDDIKK